MNYRLMMLIIFTLFFVGCNNEINNGALPPLTEEIDLPFVPLPLVELQPGDRPTEWRLIQSIPFGIVNSDSTVLEVYEDASNEDSSQLKTYHGVMNIGEKIYVLRDISSSLAEDREQNHSEIKLYERLFSEQSQYELIGSIALFANGPGLNSYIVYDVNNHLFYTFDVWGTPSFIDLDSDGKDEFVIEFPGLHLSWPDVTIIRTEQGGLEICYSVVDSIRRNQGDLAILNKDQSIPLITYSNIEDETEQAYSYIYNNGRLVSSR